MVFSKSNCQRCKFQSGDGKIKEVQQYNWEVFKQMKESTDRNMKAPKVENYVLKI